MGESKRRKEILGEAYGTRSTSLKFPQDTLPDYGEYYLRNFGTKPMKIHFLSLNFLLQKHEAFLTWKIFGHLATLIIPKDKALEIIASGQNQLLTIAPDPEDKYKSLSKEIVVPFKLVSEKN